MSCKMCFWREGDRCYNEKIAFIDTTPYKIGNITYKIKGEIIETASVKCENIANEKRHERLREKREQKLRRITNG